MINNHKSDSVLQHAKLEAQKAGHHIKDEARVQAEAAAEKAKQAAHEKKGIVAEQVHDVEKALLQTADNLDNEALGNQLRTAAGKLEQVAERIDRAELSDVVEATRELSQSYPQAFLGLSFCAGLALARFVRSSTPSPSTPSHSAPVANSPQPALPAPAPADPIASMNSHMLAGNPVVQTPQPDTKLGETEWSNQRLTPKT